MRKTAVFLMLLPFVAGCFATTSRIKARFEEKVSAYAHPDRLSEEKKAEIYEEAKNEVEVEVQAERQEAISRGAGVASDAVSGNWIGAIFGLIGLAAFGVGAVKKMKGAA